MKRHVSKMTLLSTHGKKGGEGRVRARCAVRIRRVAGGARIALRPDVPRGCASRESLMSLAVLVLGRAHLVRAARRGGTSAGATRHRTHPWRGGPRCRVRGPVASAQRWRGMWARCAVRRRAALDRHSLIGRHRAGGPAQPHQPGLGREGALRGGCWQKSKCIWRVANK